MPAHEQKKPQRYFSLKQHPCPTSPGLAPFTAGSQCGGRGLLGRLADHRAYGNLDLGPGSDLRTTAFKKKKIPRAFLIGLLGSRAWPWPNRWEREAGLGWGGSCCWPCSWAPSIPQENREGNTGRGSGQAEVAPPRGAPSPDRGHPFRTRGSLAPSASPNWCWVETEPRRPPWPCWNVPG